MKKNQARVESKVKKLKLTTETIRQLDDRQLTQAAGAASQYNVCSAICSNITKACSICCL